MPSPSTAGTRSNRWPTPDLLTFKKHSLSIFLLTTSQVVARRAAELLITRGRPPAEPSKHPAHLDPNLVQHDACPHDSTTFAKDISARSGCRLSIGQRPPKGSRRPPPSTQTRTVPNTFPCPNLQLRSHQSSPPQRLRPRAPTWQAPSTLPTTHQHQRSTARSRNAVRRPLPRPRPSRLAT